MKKVIFFLAAFALASAASAQLNQGSIWLGTDLGFSSNKSESEYIAGTISNSQESSNSSFYILPNFQYFAADNLAVVLGIGYNSAKNNWEDKTSNVTNNSKSSGFMVNLGANKYFGDSEKVKPYVGVVFGINPSNGSSEFISNVGGVTNTTESEIETSSFMASLNGGVAFVATPKLLINSNLSFLGYSSSESTATSGINEQTSKSSGINMFLNSNDFLMTVGFAWRLN